MARVLLIGPAAEDYLADGLLHGLRTLLGADVVDFPKAEHMYESYPRKSELYGHGFSLFGLLPELDVDRVRALERAEAGEFDLVVFGDIWRTYGLFTQLARSLEPHKVAVIDGADRVEIYPYARPFLRRGWSPVPIHRRYTYFKRELTTVVQRLGGRIEPISFAFPEEKIVSEPPEKTKEFNSHIVDPEVAAAAGATTDYAFERESEYYADLRASRYGVTAKREGWDALRHYEIAANGAVPCFRDLDQKPPLCAPQGLSESNCVVYSGWEDLRRKLDSIDDERYRRLQQSSLAWVRANTTRRRAEQLLAEMGL